MSEYKTRLRWTRTTSDFVYDTYDRNHALQFGGGSSIKGSAAPEYKGDAALPNPEELLVAALSSCHMLSFLALANKKRLVVDAYEDDAVGVMAKNEAGQLWISRVSLQPKVRFSGAVDAATLAELHHLAHQACFIANSVKTLVEVIEP